MIQHKRPRRESTSEEEARIYGHFREYARQGLGMLDIMFELHDRHGMNVP
jgi:hypothetical protein